MTALRRVLADPTRCELRCPMCGDLVWDLPHGHKLAKCWNDHPGVGGTGTLAFDTMTDDDEEEGES